MEEDKEEGEEEDSSDSPSDQSQSDAESSEGGGEVAPSSKPERKSALKTGNGNNGLVQAAAKAVEGTTSTSLVVANSTLEFKLWNSNGIFPGGICLLTTQTGLLTTQTGLDFVYIMLLHYSSLP